MADNRYKGEGVICDLNAIVRTGTTITAGMPIIIDVSGTNVVSHATSVAEGDRIVGMITETLTGPHTGVSYYTEGIFEMTGPVSTTEGTTGVDSPFPGASVWFVSGTIVRQWGNTASTLTGVQQFGVVTFIPGGTIPGSGAAGATLYVKLALGNRGFLVH